MPVTLNELLVLPAAEFKAAQHTADFAITGFRFPRPASRHWSRLHPENSLSGRRSLVRRHCRRNND